MTTAPTFTLDLEDHRPADGRWPARYPVLTRRMLDWLEEREIVGTFFVVGEVGAADPELVKEIAARGHEIGLHGWTHTPLTELARETFATLTSHGRRYLSELAGTAIVGYRAPTFSLTERSAWVVSILAKLGFAYSSSVLPAHNPLFGWPGAPRRPFRWPEGLVELPVPLSGPGRFAVPALGGTYLRVLPWPLVRRALATHTNGPAPWSYCHPYDFDADEPRWVVPDAGRVGSRLLWWNRAGMLDRLERVFSDGAGPPLREVARAIGFDLPVFTGVT